MDVIDLLDREEIKYLPRGGDYVISCLNPDHEDRNPSLRVDKVTGIFQCFSCGFKGNLFRHFDEEPNLLQIRRNKLKSAIDTVRASSIGLEFPKLYQSYEGTWRGISQETYKTFEAFTHHDPEFVGRLWFPIRDTTGRIAAFQGRHMGGETPKYMNFPKQAALPLYYRGEPFQKSMVMVEGMYDLVNLYDKGMQNAVCIFGTHNVSLTKLGILKMRGVERIDIFMDGDEAGQKAVEKIKRLCDQAEILHRNVYLEDKDPGQLNANQVKALHRKLYG